MQLLILRSATNKTGSRQKFVSQLASQNIPISFSFLSSVRNLINSSYRGYCDVYFNRQFDTFMKFTVSSLAKLSFSKTWHISFDSFLFYFFLFEELK